MIAEKGAEFVREDAAGGGGARTGRARSLQDVRSEIRRTVAVCIEQNQYATVGAGEVRCEAHVSFQFPVLEHSVASYPDRSADLQRHSGSHLRVDPPDQRGHRLHLAVPFHDGNDLRQAQLTRLHERGPAGRERPTPERARAGSCEAVRSP